MVCQPETPLNQLILRSDLEHAVCQQLTVLAGRLQCQRPCFQSGGSMPSWWYQKLSWMVSFSWKILVKWMMTGEVRVPPMTSWKAPDFSRLTRRKAQKLPRRPEKSPVAAAPLHAFWLDESRGFGALTSWTSMSPTKLAVNTWPAKKR